MQEARLRLEEWPLHTMTPPFLASTDSNRIVRWAKGSGSSIMEVQLMVEEYKRLAKVFSSAWLD